jgi:hypothetical protein
MFIPDPGVKTAPDPGSATLPQHCKQGVKGGTYHAATLAGDVPDLEARKEQDTDPDH